MTTAAALVFSLVTASSGAMTFDPPSPRFGDLAIAYLHNGDPSIRRAAVRVFGYEFVAFRVSDELLRAVVAVPMDIDAGDYPISFVLPSRTELGSLPVSSREFDSSKLTVSKAFTNKKSKELLARLAKEEKEFKALFEPEPGAPSHNGALERPVTGEITAVFGTRRVFNNKANTIHYGLDLDGRTGSPIRAMAPGKVVMSAMRWASGGTVILDHGGGLLTAYFHMSKRNKKTGERVEAGDLLGLVGATGRVTGPHLHLAVLVRARKLDAPKDRAARSFFVDPQPFLDLAFAGGSEPLVPRGRRLHFSEPINDLFDSDLVDGDELE